jgi:hypothetical protein
MEAAGCDVKLAHAPTFLQSPCNPTQAKPDPVYVPAPAPDSEFQIPGRKTDILPP